MGIYLVDFRGEKERGGEKREEQRGRDRDREKERWEGGEKWGDEREAGATSLGEKEKERLRITLAYLNVVWSPTYLRSCLDSNKFSYS